MTTQHPDAALDPVSLTINPTDLGFMHQAEVFVRELRPILGK